MSDWRRIGSIAMMREMYRAIKGTAIVGEGKN
jgi:hypothetical protein